jgi:N-acetylglutamate synthase-like GNAT family acetyltransferase
MTARILPRKEWHRLTGTQLETVVPVLRRERGRVLVVERDGEIVGCVALYRLWHLEGLEIKQPTATRALLGAIKAQTAQIPAVVSWAQNPIVGEFLDRLGAEVMPGRHYAWKP